MSLYQAIGTYHGYTIEIATLPDPCARAAQALEQEVFIDAGYSRDADEHAHNYDCYDERSIFTLIQQNNVPYAAGRLILSHEHAQSFQESGLKGINDTLWPSDQWGGLDINPEGWKKLSAFSPTTTIEVATAAIPNERRSARLPLLLTAVEVGVSIGVQALRDPNSKPAVLSSCDESYYKQHRVAFGETIDPIGDFCDYGNSPTINVIVDILALRAYDLARKRPILNQSLIDDTAKIITTHGLEGINS